MKLYTFYNLRLGPKKINIEKVTFDPKLHLFQAYYHCLFINFKVKY
jgi:hypothetical protein